MALAIKSDDLGKLVLRLTLGVLMLFHGVSKLMQPAATLSYMTGQLANLGLPGFVAYGVFIGEVLAPLMIIFGVFSRIGGLIVVINMVFAIVMVHPGQILALGKTGGWALELQGFYLLTGLALLFLGSGKLAIRSD